MDNEIKVSDREHEECFDSCEVERVTLEMLEKYREAIEELAK